MDTDSIVEEVHRAREQLLEQASGDLDRLVDLLQQSEAISERPVFSRAPKKSDGAPESAA